MGHGKHNSQRGFTLIAALLIMVLLSGVAAGILYLVGDEDKMGGNDLEANLAYYGAESGMEKLSADLSALYQQNQAPGATQIQALTANPPTAAMVGDITYPNPGTAPGYAISYLNQSGAAVGAPTPFPSTITQGSNSGLYALVTELQLQVQAVRPSGATASMTRTLEVAEIPVFQFGVFCGYDCSFFAGPDFSFGGRVHTNMNLFLASGADLVFNDKVQAFQQIITDRLENGFATSANYGGTTYVPDASGGCALGTFPPTGATCKSLPGAGTVPGDASWSGGYPPAGTKNTNFPTISTGTFNTYLANSTTGVTNLQLPFVTNSCVSNPPPCTDPITIIRKPLVGESSTGPLGVERLYNKAQIRILLADDPNDLHPERGIAPLAGEAPPQDIQLPSNTAWGVAPFTTAAVNLTAGGTESVGFATAGANGWVKPYNGDAGASTAWGTWPLMEAFSFPPTGAMPAGTATTGPWIRVEYCNTTSCNQPADWVGVTTEWLNLGFGRQFNAQITPATPNLVDPNAILILQQLRPSLAQANAAQAQASGHGAGTSGNWYPINFYDVREGEMRDNPVNNTTLTPAKGAAGYPDSFTYSSCSTNGIMNAVELDVGNLNKWLQGKTGLGTGTKVNYSNNNGYVLYFSDHRGMRKDTWPSNGGQTPAGVYSGESGLEDVVNSAVALTAAPPVPDGALEAPKYYQYSPEDVDQNNELDNWGEIDLGYGFGINSNVNPKSPYTRIGVTAGASYTAYVDCAGYDTTAGAWLTGNNDQEGMANVVSGARHVLKLVDGTLGNLPTMPPGNAINACTQSAANPTGCGGFTVASENPVYIQGDYNSSAADPFWGTATAATPTQTPHSAASVIADAVTVLSDQWSDANSLLYPTTLGNRATTTAAYYRTAVSGGKNIPFPQPGFAGVANDFGTDGGMHNFLRYLESWGNTLHYNGSLVSMYYAEYDTGTFKCCTVVYSPPTRDYYFDSLFLNSNNLPPATPMIQDVVTLSYHQNFSPNVKY